MIQRIQSVFLLASLGFLIPMFFIPVAGLVSLSGEIYAFDLTGFFQTEGEKITFISRQYSLMIFGILICAVNAVIIFLYRHRVLQMRWCIYNIILIAGLLGITLFIIGSVREMGVVSCHLPVVFPVVSVIFHYLAYRSIRRDELTVRALSRLR